MIIDAHQHFWRVDRGDYGWLTPAVGPIYRDFMPEDLAPTLTRLGIDGTILVQAAPTVAETRFMLEIACRWDAVKGVVGWVDFEDPEAGALMAELRSSGPLVGVRPMIQDIPDDDWVLWPDLEPAFQSVAGLGLVFDALVFPRHLRRLLHLLERHPQLRTVIDHGAKPEIRSRAFADWAQGMVHQSRVGGPVFEAVLDMFERRSPDVFAAQIHALLNRPDATPLLPGIACPTLVLTGEHDAWSPPEAHRRIQGLIPGAQLVLVPGSGHMTTMEEPAAVTAAIAAWLAA